MELEEIYPTTLKYQPSHDKDGEIIEDESDYILRIRQTMLPNWPEELLKEWLYRHPCHLEKYAFLNFERFKFMLETWFLEDIPGREAFDDENFLDRFQNIEERAESKNDWLANYMLQTGTWNTPIVLLNNPGNYYFPSEKPLKYPYHLIEGHRRLSFLNGLRRLNKALQKHQVWVINIQR
ncbi:hypothetical protein PN499_24160 [Kamptonema animale CS-326]|jgi:hypothetical protein|uniref:hypothetical protein n=1 Tax=Kamptonema animale TaxID=92934 RepID=UPI00232D8400|nr:hypothetical protein [Kamptonema animale]MDB9514299.1 hypothetical protein [Kamptonema animale CS-326]